MHSYVAGYRYGRPRMNILCTGQAGCWSPVTGTNAPMVPLSPSPSPRLRRAASAERRELGRHHARLLAARESLREELARVESSLQELAERQILLDRLAGPADANAGDEQGANDQAASAGSHTGHGQVLRGPAIRRTAVEVLLADPGRPEAMHYRDWFEKLRGAGFEVAGKDPLAVFLTQISRSPVVRKSTQAGVYELDMAAPQRLRRRLDQLHDQLRQLTAAPSDSADLASIRARRSELNTEIGRVEKLLEEADAALRPTGRNLAATG